MLIPSLMSSNDGPLSVVRYVYPSNDTFVKWIQTLAVAEILHSLLGLVRAPATTTGLQVASRLLLVWGVVGMFGGEGLLEARGMMGDVVGKGKKATGGYEVHRSNQVAYLGMLVAWAVTECVRYTYFVILLISGAIPKWLSWLRCVISLWDVLGPKVQQLTQVVVGQIQYIFPALSAWHQL